MQYTRLVDIEPPRFHAFATPAMQKYSQLYGSDGALVGAFQRMDIPILPQLDQYNYVLFTGAHWARGLAAAGAMALPA